MIPVRKIVLLALFFYSINLFSQAQLLKESKIISSNHETNGIIASDISGFYNYRVNNVAGVPHLYIEKRSLESLETMFSQELIGYSKLQELVRRSNPYIETFFVNKKVYCFYNYIDNEKDTMYVMLQTVTEGGVVSDMYNVLKVYTRNTFASADIKFSPDGKQFLVAPNAASEYLNPFDPNGKPLIELKTALYESESLNLLWEKNISKYVEGKSYRVSNLQTDNNGNLYFLINEDYKAPVLSVIERASPTIKKFSDLLLHEYEYSALSISILPNGNVLLAGVFEDKIKKIKGFHSDPSLFVRVVDPNTLLVKTNKDYPFSMDIVSKLSQGRDQGKPSPTAVPHSQFNGPIVSVYNSGFFYLIQDVFYNVGKISGFIQFKDAICFDLDFEGNLKYSTIIPKHKDFITYSKMDVDILTNEDEANILLQESTILENKNFSEYESVSMDSPKKDKHNVVIAKFQAGKLQKIKLRENINSLPRLTPKNNNCILAPGKVLVVLLENTKNNQIQFASYKIN
ncbi:MAG: hypothetical protein J0L87_11650 [Bacteroidetes bacterium]|nr:hypothetical protein [Bacteroidota bacterium]